MKKKQKNPKQPKKQHPNSLPEKSGVFVRTEAELELLPHLRSKFLGFEHVTFG